MAVDEHNVRKLNSSFQRLRREYEAARVRLAYNELSDTLYIYVITGLESLVSVPQNDGFTALMVDPVAEEVHGFQIDDYLQNAVLRMPHLLELAKLAEIDHETITSARAQIDSERLRESTITTSLSELLGRPVRSRRT
jgi:hypothetical protein